MRKKTRRKGNDNRKKCSVTFDSQTRKDFFSQDKAIQRHILSNGNRQIHELRLDRNYVNVLYYFAKKYGSFTDYHPICDQDDYPMFYYKYRIVHRRLLPIITDFDFHIIISGIYLVDYKNCQFTESYYNNQQTNAVR